MRRLRATLRGVRCIRCSRAPLTPCVSCSRCIALYMEKGDHLRGMQHDTDAHAAMLAMAHDPSAHCAVSGYSGAALAACELRLEVDRIDPRLGYLVGNMQLLAGPLNRAKQYDNILRPYQVHALQVRMGDAEWAGVGGMHEPGF